MATAIIDIGSGFIKAGLQTDPYPTYTFPSFVGRPRRRYTHLYDENAIFLGDDAIENRHHLSFVYPIDHGHIDNFADVEELLSYTLTQSLKINTTDISILVTEPPFASSQHREFLAQTMFESFDVAEINLSIQGVIALYAAGRTAGLVVEIGEGVTQVVPVHDGFTDKVAIRRSDFGGQELTMYLQKLLCDLGYPLTTRDDVEHVRIMKETLCYVASDPSEDNKTDLTLDYTLPDGTQLRDGKTKITLNKERFYCPEALFEPRIIHRDNPPLHDLVWQVAQASPIEIRKTCLNSVILSGGCSMFPGLRERLELELKEMSPAQARSSVRVYADDERLFGVWLGAKLFCDPALRPIQDIFWITKDEWLEIGSAIVERKTPFRTSS